MRMFSNINELKVCMETKLDQKCKMFYLLYTGVYLGKKKVNLRTFVVVIR